MPIPKRCERCNSEYLPTRTWQKFCSRFCSQASYWDRKLKEPPRDILDPLPTGASAAQEAEWKRRSDIAKAATIIPANAAGEELLREAQEALARQKPKVAESSPLNDWLLKPDDE